MENESSNLITKLCGSLAQKTRSKKHIIKLRKIAYCELLKCRTNGFSDDNNSFKFEETMDTLYTQLVDTLLRRNDWDVYDRQYLDECFQHLKHSNENIDEDFLISVLKFLICLSRIDPANSVTKKTVNSELELESCFQRQIYQFSKISKLHTIPDKDFCSNFDWDNFYEMISSPLDYHTAIIDEPHYQLFDLYTSLNFDRLDNDYKMMDSDTISVDEGFVSPEWDINQGETKVADDTASLSCALENSSMTSDVSTTAKDTRNNDCELKFATELFESIIHLRKLSQINSNNVSSMLSQISFSQLVQDLKYLLRAIPSSSFLYYEKENLFQMRYGLYTDSLTPELLSDYCEEFISCANYYLALKAFIEHESVRRKYQGVIFPTFCRCIAVILKTYQAELLESYWNNCSSLVQLSVYANQLKAKLSFIADFCIISPGKSAANSSLPNGANLLNYIYCYMNKVISSDLRFLLYYIFKECCNSYFSLLSDWIFDGTFEKSQKNELFVTIDDGNIKLKDRRWLDGFICDTNLIPEFLNEIYPDIMSCGKLIRLLKDQCLEISQYRILMMNRPKIKCIFQKDQLEDYCSEWEDFYNSCHSFFQVTFDIRQILKVINFSQESYDYINLVKKDWMEQYKKKNLEYLTLKREMKSNSQKMERNVIEEFLSARDAYKASQLLSEDESNSYYSSERSAVELTELSGKCNEPLETPFELNKEQTESFRNELDKNSTVTSFQADSVEKDYSDGQMIQCNINVDSFGDYSIGPTSFGCGVTNFGDHFNEQILCDVSADNSADRSNSLSVRSFKAENPDSANSNVESVDIDKSNAALSVEETSDVQEEDIFSSSGIYSAASGTECPVRNYISTYRKNQNEAEENRRKILSSQFTVSVLSSDGEEVIAVTHDNTDKLNVDTEEIDVSSPMPNVLADGDGFVLLPSTVARSEAVKNKLKILSSEFGSSSTVAPAAVKGSISVQMNRLKAMSDSIRKTFSVDVNRASRNFIGSSSIATSEAVENKRKIMSSKFGTPLTAVPDKVGGSLDVRRNRFKMMSDSIGNIVPIATDRDSPSTVYDEAARNKQKVLSSEFDIPQSNDNSTEAVDIFSEKSHKEQSGTAANEKENEEKEENGNDDKEKSIATDEIKSVTLCNTSNCSPLTDDDANNDSEISFEFDKDPRDIYLNVKNRLIRNEKSSKPFEIGSDNRENYAAAEFLEANFDRTDITTISKYLHLSTFVPLQVQMRLLNNAMLTLFVKKLGYIDCLMSLKNYFFLQDVDFLLSIKVILFHRLNYKNTVNIRCIFDDLTSRFDTRLSLKLDKLDHCPIDDLCSKFLECTSMHYSVHWPLNILITDEMIQSYNQIFKFLLRIIWAQWFLNDNFRKLRNWRAHNSQQYKQVQLYRHIMTHFFSTVLIYIEYDVVQTSWNKLVRNLTEKSITLDTLYVYHKNYLDEIITGMILNSEDSSFYFHNCLSDLFNFVWKFNHLLENEGEWRLNAEVELLYHTKYKELQQVYCDFVAGMKQFRYSLKHLMHNGHSSLKPLYKKLFYNSGR